VGLGEGGGGKGGVNGCGDRRGSCVDRGGQGGGKGWGREA